MVHFAGLCGFMGRGDALPDVVQISGSRLKEENAGRPALVSAAWRAQHTWGMPRGRGSLKGSGVTFLGVPPSHVSSTPFTTTQEHRVPLVSLCTELQNVPWTVPAGGESLFLLYSTQLPETSSLKTRSVEGGGFLSPRWYFV